jgi:hypothetical protein
MMPTTEVIDMLPEGVKRTFTVGTSTALHQFEARTNFSLVLHIVPRVNARAEFCQTYRHLNGVAIQFAHSLGLLPTTPPKPEGLEANQSVAILNEWMAFSKVSNKS